MAYRMVKDFAYKTYRDCWIPDDILFKASFYSVPTFCSGAHDHFPCSMLA
jgi:hypothetical protein